MLLACTLALSSCVTDDTSAPEHEPDVVVMRITVANQQVEVKNSGEITGQEIVLHAGVTVSVSAVFLNASGERVDGVTAALYQLNGVTSGPVPITFTRSNSDPFSGTIVCNVPNVTGHILFSLYNIEKQHDLWGPADVPFVISN